jgi:uncharacterized membrane protein
MAFCSKCGSALSDGVAFCSVCGSPSSSTGSTATPPAPVEAEISGLRSNVIAALSYFFITGIIFLLMEQFKKDPFVRFHSFQSIAYGVVVMVFSIVWGNILLASLGFLSVIFGLVNALINLAIFAYWLFLMYKAYNNETYKIPVIGDWAFKQAAK